MLWLVRGGAFYQIDLKGMTFHKEGETWVVELDAPEVVCAPTTIKWRR